MIPRACVRALVAAMAAAAFGQPTPLVNDGRAVCSICTGPQPSATVELGAKELQTYLGKMSRATVRIVDALPDRAPGILLGAKAAEASREPVDLSGLGPEGCVLKSLPGGRIVAAGRTDLGTLNAAYDLLHVLGVRWFMPGEAGEHVPRARSLSAPPLDRRFEPSFSYRRIWEAANRLPAPQRQEYADWQRRNRMPGAMAGATGHAYDRIVSRRDNALFAEKPHLFAEVGGKRTNRGQICTTQPEVVARAVAYARAYFAKHPDHMMVSLSPNDGAGFCRCKTCCAVGSPSDNALMLANRVAEAIEAEYPGTFVAFYAYAGTSPPPALSGRANVIVWIATRFIRPGYTLEQLVAGWSAKVHHIGIREYYSVTPWSWQMPRHDPEGLAESLRYYHDHKAAGVSAESEDNFGSRGANYYVAATSVSCSRRGTARSGSARRLAWSGSAGPCWCSRRRRAWRPTGSSCRPDSRRRLTWTPAATRPTGSRWPAKGRPRCWPQVGRGCSACVWRRGAGPRVASTSARSPTWSGPPKIGRWSSSPARVGRCISSCRPAPRRSASACAPRTTTASSRSETPRAASRCRRRATTRWGRSSASTRPPAATARSGRWRSRAARTANST